MASICGAGDSWEEAMKNAVEASDCIKAYCSGADTSAQLYFKDALEIMKKYGVELTPVAIQKEEASLEHKLEEIEANQIKQLFCKSCNYSLGVRNPSNSNFECPNCKSIINEKGEIIQPLIPRPKEQKNTIQ
jgi:ribosomal protein L37AE/L43A